MRTIFFEKSVPRVLLTLGLKKVWSGAVFAASAPVRAVELAQPALPGDGGIRVKNRICGICASDLHVLYVDIDPMVHPAALPGNPRIYLGHEVVSEVTEVGPSVQELAPGDRVLMKSRFLGPQCSSQGISPVCHHCRDGNYCLCVNQAAGKGVLGVGGGWGDGYTCHESEVWKLPDEIDDDEGALIEPLACCVRAVLRRRPAPKERVLVLGCGTIGLGTIQAIRVIQPEAEIFAVARYPQQIEMAQKYGATVFSSSDVLSETANATGAHLYKGDFNNRTLLGGFDVIYDCVGNGTTLSQSLRMARAGGCVVVVGVYLHRVKIDMTPVWSQEVDLIGALAHGQEDWQGESISTFALTARWIQEGKLQTEGLITHRFPFSDWKEAVRVASNKRSGCIKVVFQDEHA